MKALCVVAIVIMILLCAFVTGVHVQNGSLGMVAFGLFWIGFSLLVLVGLIRDKGEL